jgi:hypothetical protein
MDDHIDLLILLSLSRCPRPKPLSSNSFVAAMRVWSLSPSLMILTSVASASGPC